MIYLSDTGHGAHAIIDGHPHFIGYHRMAHDTGVCTPEVEALLSEIESNSQFLAVLGHAPHEGCAGKIFGIIDSVKPIVEFLITAEKKSKSASLTRLDLRRSPSLRLTPMA